MDKTLAFLCMTHDDAGGEISLEPKTDGVCIKWDKVGRQQNFATVNEHLKEITAKLDGTFVINPLWSKKMGRELITAHPLGGCPMGEDGSLGVVNHKGQVFDGKFYKQRHFWVLNILTLYKLYAVVLARMCSISDGVHY